MNSEHEKNSAGWLFLTTYLAFETIPSIIMAFFNKYADSYAYTLVSLTLVQAVMAAAFFIYKKASKKDITAGINLKKFPRLPQILIIVVLSIVSIYAGNSISGLMVAFLSKTGMKISLINPQTDTAVKILFSVICIGMLPAFSEELFIRQGVLSGLKQSMPKYKAILLSALMFSLMHTNAAQTLHQFFMGITVATLVMLDGSLWSGILFHFINNAYVLLTCVISPSTATVDFTKMDVSGVAWAKAIALFIGGYIIIAIGLIIFAAFSHKEKAKACPDEEIKEDVEAKRKPAFFNTRIGIFVDGGLQEIRSFFAKPDSVPASRGNGLIWAFVVLVAIWTLVFITGYMV